MFAEFRGCADGKSEEGEEEDEGRGILAELSVFVNF